MFLNIGDFFVKKVKGFTKVDNENVLFNMNLSPFSKLVFTYLIFYTRNGSGVCFCKKTTLSKMVGISLYHLRKSLCELEELGLINITRRRQGNPDDIRVNDFKVKPEQVSTPNTLYEEDLKEKNSNHTNINESSSKPLEKNTYRFDKDISPPPETDTLPTRTSLIDTPRPNDVKPIPEPTERLKSRLKSILRVTSYEHFFKSSVVLELNEHITKIGVDYSVLQNDIISVYTPTIKKILGVTDVHFVPMKGLIDDDNFKEGLQRV